MKPSKKNNQVDKRVIKLQGEVVEALSGSEYRVKIKLNDETEKIVTAYSAGKLSNNRIKILEGDIVDVELDKNSAHGKGRIVYRHTAGRPPIA
ncbi:translation initiation factor IF-1 [Rickettsiales bacterium LUAb2]